MTWKRLLHPAFIIAFLLLSVSALGMSAAIKAYGFHLQKKEIYPFGNRQVSALPRETPTWKQVGTDEALDEDTIKTLGTRNFVSRVFIEKDPPPTRQPHVLELHVAYYTGGIDTVPHVPERCMVAGGWTQSRGAQTIQMKLDPASWLIDSTLPPDLPGGPLYTARTLPAPYSDAPGTRFRLPTGLTPDTGINIRVTEFFLPGSTSRLHAGYFFIANGGMAASAESVRTLAFDLTNDYAYYLKVQVSGRGFESADQMVSVASSLMSELIAELMRCVPDWAQVQLGTYPDDNPRRLQGTN